MADSRKWAEVVKRLAAQTEKGEIHWGVHDAPREDAIGPVYAALVEGNTFLCYEYSYQEYPTSGPPEAETRVAVEFVGSRINSPYWRLPETPHDYALLDAIRYKESGAADFLASFLNKK